MTLSVPNIFANLGGDQPAATLDANFSTIVNWINSQGLSLTVTAPPYSATGNGTTDDTVAIQAAVSAAYAAGAWLYWPPGTYLTSSSIANLHNVRHWGPGAIKRGSTLFYVAPTGSQTNTLFVSTTGNDANDGLGTSQALLTLQAGLNRLINYGPILGGNWTIQLAAGTYTSGSRAAAIRSISRLVIKGPNVGGFPNVPTAIIDGTADVTNPEGIRLGDWMYAQVQDLKIINFNHFTVGYGVSAERYSNVICQNVHTSGCSYAGLNAEYATRLFVDGGIIENGTAYGVRGYGSSSVTVGYNAGLASDRPIIRNNTVGNVYITTGTESHVYYCDLSNSQANIRVEHQSVAHVKGTTATGASVADLICEPLSSWYDDPVDPSTYSSTVKYYHAFSVDWANRTIMQFDKATQRLKWGDTSYAVPLYPFHFANGAPGTITYNGNTKFLIESSSETRLSMGGKAGTNIGIHFQPVTGSPGAGYLLYEVDTGYLHFANAGVETYRMTTNDFSPSPDNTRKLGSASLRWTEVFAAVGTINTSDEREKQQGRSLSDAERAVAARIKGKIKAFKWNEAVEQKGDGARWHFGVYAQEVAEAFQAEGLDPHAYGLFCYDEWEAEPAVIDADGQVVREARAAGNRYGVRYDELLCFVLGAI